MTATVRLDNRLESTLEKLSSILHKNKSDVIREAISFYAKNIDKEKKTKLLNAIKKTKYVDKKDFKDFEGILDDGL